MHLPTKSRRRQAATYAITFSNHFQSPFGETTLPTALGFMGKNAPKVRFHSPFGETALSTLPESYYPDLRCCSSLHTPSSIPSDLDVYFT